MQMAKVQFLLFAICIDVNVNMVLNRSIEQGKNVTAISCCLRIGTYMYRYTCSMGENMRHSHTCKEFLLKFSAIIPVEMILTWTWPLVDLWSSSKNNVNYDNIGHQLD